MSTLDSRCKERLRSAQGGDASQDAAEVLLECFRRGRLSRQDLVNLALSDRTAAAELGVWIASELPESIGPIFGQLLPCLDHPSHRVRHSMLDVLSSQAATDVDGHIDALIVAHVYDEHVAVRCKAIELMARWSAERIELAVSSLRAAEAGQAAFEATFGRRSPVVTDDELNELRTLVSAVRARNEFEDGAIRVSRSRSQRMAETARALLPDVRENQG